MDRVITYNLHDNFIRKLADYICEHYAGRGRDFSRIAIVFGGRRPSLFLKKEMARHIKGAFVPPRFFTIDEFVEYAAAKESAFSRIADLDACYAIYRLTAAAAPEVLAGRESFAQFLPWAREILSFIEQMDLEDIRSVRLANVQLKAQIGYDVPESVNRLLAGIVGVRAAFHEYLEKEKTYSRGFTYLKACRISSRLDLGEFDAVLFCGFFYLHKTEETIIRAIAAGGKGVLFFQGDQEEWSVLDRTARALDVRIEHPALSDRPVCASAQPDAAAVSAQPEITIHAGFDTHSQVCLVREALKKIKEPEKTVIVAALPEHVIPLLSEISSCVNNYNVSIGYPLSRSALYSLFTAVFKAQETRPEAGGGFETRPYYSRDYIAALAHPLIKNLKVLPSAAATRVLAHKIEEILTGMEKTSLGGSLFISLREIEHSPDVYSLAMEMMKRMDIEVSYDDLKRAVKELHGLVFGAWEGLNNFADFAAALERLMDALAAASMLESFPLNVNMAQRIFAIRQELSHAAFKAETFPQDELFRIFQDKLSHEMISFAGSPLKGLQILGLLETRSLNFAHVIFMDMNESAMPNLKIYEPLIPREVMINLGLNRLEKEEEIQRYQFRRLIAGARTVTLIYQDSADKEKSRFIEEIIWQRQRREKSLDAVSIGRAAFNVSVLPERMRVDKDEKIGKFLRGHEYSASSINTYLDCPLRFYFQYVLGLREKEDLLDEPEGADVGNFIHGFLEDAFRPCVGAQPVIDASFRKKFRLLRDERFEREFGRKMKSDAFLLKEVVDFRLEKFLENEERREVREIIGLETRLRGKLKLAAGEFSCAARIDRIDRLADGSILVLDYKTGHTDIVPDADAEKLAVLGRGREDIKRCIKSFQLPLYLYLVDSQPQWRGQRTNAALYSLREIGDNFGLRRLLRNEEQMADKEQIMSAYWDSLDALFTEIFDSNIPFVADEADDHRCAYCPFVYLCR